MIGALLTAGARWDAEYRGGLSNHLPMALLALQRLGAGGSRLEAFAVRYATRLEPAPAGEPWPAGADWPARLGERAAWPAYRTLFREWLTRDGTAEVLRRTLQLLMSGCAAAAFHGMIRTAYAVQSGHQGELADGLAYWSCRFLRLGPWPDGTATEQDPERLLRRLRAGTSNKRLIFEQMDEAARGSPALRRAMVALAVDEGTPERLARLSAGAYAGSGDFTALHLVTSCHAMRVLSPFLDGARLAGWRWYWQAWVTAVVAAGMHARPAVALRPWAQIVDAARRSDDDHLIKLVDSCREEERAYGGDDWQRAASRAIV